MSILVAIDPGYARRGRGCAVAIFTGRALTCVYFERAETITRSSLAVGASEIVWECPQCDARSRTIAPTLIELTAAGALLAGMFAGACGCRAVAVMPRDWKGSLAKPVAHSRMWARLDTVERELLGGNATAARIEAAKRAGALDRWARSGGEYYGAWLGHNLLDASGLGMWRLER